MTTTERKYFIVRVTFHQVKAASGSILTEEDSAGILTMTTGDYSGYAQCAPASPDSVGGNRFKSAPSMTEVMNWDGLPWYYRIKTAEVVEVNEIEVRSLERKTKSHGAPK